jgi:predicted nucleic acid-binding protein
VEHRSQPRATLEDLIRRGERIVVPEAVLLELLSGPTDEVLAMRRRRMLETFQIVPYEPMVDSLRAAALQRECRRSLS